MIAAFNAIDQLPWGLRLRLWHWGRSVPVAPFKCQLRLRTCGCTTSRYPVSIMCRLCNSNAAAAYPIACAYRVCATQKLLFHMLCLQLQLAQHLWRHSLIVFCILPAAAVGVASRRCQQTDAMFTWRSHTVCACLPASLTLPTHSLSRLIWHPYCAYTLTPSLTLLHSHLACTAHPTALPLSLPLPLSH